MAKKYCKYTTEQLQQYCKNENSCVKCVSGHMHLGLPPWGLSKFEETVRDIVSEQKFNRFDVELNGIVLDVQSIKVSGGEYSVVNDSPALHIGLNVNFYVFQPHIGSVLEGIIMHVALHHISVTIHRFFNVTIPMEKKDNTLKINMRVMVKLTNMDLTDSIPYFEGKVEKVIKNEMPKKSVNIGIAQIKEEKITNGRTDSDSDSSSSYDASRTKIKQEKITNGRTTKSSDSDSDSDDCVNRNATSTKVKTEPVSSSEAQSSDSEREMKPKISGKLMFPKQVLIKKEPNYSSSSSDDTNFPIDNGRSKQQDDTAVNRKIKHSIKLEIQHQPTKTIKKEKLESTSTSSSSSSSSDDEIASKKKKNTSLGNLSFKSPGLSSTKIVKKKKNRSASDFLQKMIQKKSFQN